MTKALGSGLIGLLFGDDDDDEEKSLDKTAGQALVSSFTSLAFGRDFGNATKTIVNYGLERINEEHLGFLREGEYDPYKDAIQFTAVPVDKKGEQTDLFDYYKNFTGAFGPSVKTLDLIVKTYSDKEKKEASAIERQERVKSERIPLEVLGNLGYVPLYKEIRKEVIKDIYKDLDKKKETGTELTTEELDEVNTLNDLLDTEKDSKTKRVIKKKLNEILYDSKEDKEAKKALKKKLLNGYKNQEDLKRYDRETWEKNFGENSKWYKENEPEREVNKKLEEIKRAKMDEEYNYIETSEEDYKFGPQKKKSGGYKFGAQ
jgi:hypothetical protein